MAEESNSSKQDLEELYQLFREKAAAISAEVYRAATISGAGNKIAEIIGDLKALKVVAARSKLLESMNLNRLSVIFENLRLHTVDADLGISEFDIALAETGTLVQNANSIDDRLVSMLPPCHVALVRTDRLVATLRDVLELFNCQLDTLPHYLSFVSGPSRTADIERVLTIGVHGPERLFIVFVDQTGGEQE